MSEIEEIRKRVEGIEQMAERLRGHTGIQAAWISAANLEGIAADLRTLLAALPQWVSVEKRLPVDSGLVLIYPVQGCIDYGCYDFRYNCWRGHIFVREVEDIVDDVTHWMPLPATPQEEGGE